MPGSKPWLKMWAEWLSDPKMDHLSLAGQAAWWRLVTLAHQHGENGSLHMQIGDVMKSLKIYEPTDKQVFTDMVEWMQSQGSIHFNSDTLVVTNLAARQQMAPTDAAERQRRHRDKLKAEHVTKNEPKTASKNRHVTNVTPPPRPSIIVPPPKRERRGEIGDVFVTSCDISVTSQILASLSKLYEEFIGKLSESVSEELKCFCEDYKGKVEWLRPAFVAGKNKKSWRYTKAILERYEIEGGPNAGDSKKQRGVTPQPKQERRRFEEVDGT